MVIGANGITAAAASLPSGNILRGNVSPPVRPDHAAVVRVHALGVSTVAAVLIFAGEGLGDRKKI